MGLPAIIRCGVTMPVMRHHRFGRTEEAGERGHVVNAEVVETAAAFLEEPGRPGGPVVPIGAVGRSHPAELAGGDHLGHEAELRAGDHGRRGPESHALCLGQGSSSRPSATEVAIGFSHHTCLPAASAALLSGKWAGVEVMFTKIPAPAGQQLVDVRVGVRNVEPLGRRLGPLGDDVAGELSRSSMNGRHRGPGIGPETLPQPITPTRILRA